MSTAQRCLVRQLQLTRSHRVHTSATYTKWHHRHRSRLYVYVIPHRCRSQASKLVHNDSTSSRWIGTYRALPPIIYQIPFILAFGFIFYVSFDWIGPYIKPGLFEEEERRAAEKLLFRIDQYLDWNSLRDDIIVLESGLQYKKINRKSISDEKPTLSDTVLIHYQGQYMDGTEFDNSIDKNRPVSVRVNTLNDGLREGIQCMNEGDSFEFYVHPKLGYGYKALDKAPGEVGIEKNAVLIYSVKLIKIMRGEHEPHASYTIMDENADDLDKEAYSVQKTDTLFTRY